MLQKTFNIVLLTLFSVFIIILQINLEVFFYPQPNWILMFAVAALFFIGDAAFFYIVALSAILIGLLFNLHAALAVALPSLSAIFIKKTLPLSRNVVFLIVILAIMLSSYLLIDYKFLYFYPIIFLKEAIYNIVLAAILSFGIIGYKRVLSHTEDLSC